MPCDEKAMRTPPSEPHPDAEIILRGVVDACADCDTCRFLMDESCLLFPRLYQLWDEERDTGRPIQVKALYELAELCTLCGLCPCPNIRTDIIQAKAARVEREGLPIGIRALADVQRLAQMGGLAPKLIDRILSISPVSRSLKRLLEIHPQRNLPRIAPESFFSWARKKGLNRRVEAATKVAYFVGCTAGYLFPEVARAAVWVLEHNDVAVHVPPQQCCGMPTLLEGDKQTTLGRVEANLISLGELGQQGYEVVCSCPTCGYLMKVLLKENACYSKAYQKTIKADADHIMVPDDAAGEDGFIRVKKSIYKNILKDNGLFSDISPLDRMKVSAQVEDLGVFLCRLLKGGRLNLDFGPLEGRMVYHAPCHQREQAIGSPYLDILSEIPRLTILPVGSAMDCCGMGGSLGYKHKFHEDSIRIGNPLVEKIRAADPTAIVTDCLSCRLQFQHRLPYPVIHPLELLYRSYTARSRSHKSN
jgi:glycerol-3-phosphate dehydrogenase subunit C